MQKVERRGSGVILFYLGLTVVAFIMGLMWSGSVEAAQKKKKPKVVYPKRSKLDFDGLGIDGMMNRPGEFYFEHKPQDKFDSLVKRRKNFHREILRDVVLSR